MTTARSDEATSPLSRTPDRDKRIAAEVRAEIARQDRPESQAEMAFTIFGEKQAWLNRRLRGVTAFTPGELLELADWLGVDVVQFLGAARKPPTEGALTDVGTHNVSRRSISQYLHPFRIIQGEGDATPERAELSVAV